MLNASEDSTRIAAAELFGLLSDSILRAPGGTSLSFYNIRAMSLVVSPDNHLRLYNWMLLLDKGNRYQFFGYAAFRQDKKMPYRILKLEEKKYSDNEATSYLKLDSTTWLGCVYYKIIQQRYNKKTTYIALGWAPQSLLTTRKIIEPMSFSTSKITLGAPVFKAKGTKAKSRVIFEYNARATMSLRYEEKQDRIVFDHLSPSDPRPESKGVYSLYGPDLTYDAYVFKQGSWMYQSDLQMGNNGLNEGKEGKFFGK